MPQTTMTYHRATRRADGAVELWEDITIGQLAVGDITPSGRVKRTFRVGAEVVVTLEDGRPRRCWYTNRTARRVRSENLQPA